MIFGAKNSILKIIARKRRGYAILKKNQMYINKSRSFCSCKASFRSLKPLVSSDNRFRVCEKRLERIQPSRYPYTLLKRDTWSIMPIRRILLRTVSSTRGVKPYLSQSGVKYGRNCWGAYFSSIKIARNTF